MNEYKKQILSTILELQMEYNTFNLMIFGDEVHITNNTHAYKVTKNCDNKTWAGLLEVAEVLCHIS